MRIKVVTHMVGELPYFPYSKALNESYCQQHGYEYVIGNQVLTDRHIVWCKILPVIEELPTADYVLYIDADAFFNERSKRIEDVLLPLLAEDQFMLLATNCIGKNISCQPNEDSRIIPNAGVYLIKNTPVSRAMMAEWNQIPVDQPEYAFEWPVDQRALADIIAPKYSDYIRILVQNYHKLNGRDGTFIRHMLGTNMNDIKTQVLKLACKSLGLRV